MPLLQSFGRCQYRFQKRTPQYYSLIDNLFDTYLGKLPEKFTYKGKEYTPQSFTESLGLNMDNYIELTSFTHKPYYETFTGSTR